MSLQKVKVVFCGLDDFSSAYAFTKEILEAEENDVVYTVVSCDRQHLHSELMDTNVLIPLMTRITEDMINGAPNLKMIMQFGVGIEGVDIRSASRNGVFVCNIPSEDSGNAEACAEMCIYLALSVLRDARALSQSIMSGRLGTPTGRTLFRSNVIIFGIGGMGKNLLKRLIPFGISIICVVARDTDKAAAAVNNICGSLDTTTVKCVSQSDMHLFSSIADVLFLCCSQNRDNIGMVNAEFISKLKPGCIIVNVARGGLLNYEDVSRALDSGQLGGLGLDVFHTEPFPADDPLLSHSKVVATPHVGGVTHLSYRSMAKLTADNIIRLASGQQPMNVLNFRELAEMS